VSALQHDFAQLYYLNKKKDNIHLQLTSISELNVKKTGNVRALCSFSQPLIVEESTEQFR
jgi:hypothetical protein